MAQISLDEVRELSKLARIALSPKEAEGYAHDLSAILQHMQDLAKIDTDGVLPMTHPNQASLRLREDNPAGATDFDRQVALSASSHMQDEQFLLPLVIENVS